MKARSQSEHERINAQEYPGTRQMCTACDSPTDKCKEDTLGMDIDHYHWWHTCTIWHGPLCEVCYHEMNGTEDE